MKINTDKTKLMMNSAEGIGRDIRVTKTCIEEVDQFKYLGSIVSDKGSKPKVLSKTAQAIQAMVRLKAIWKDKIISVRVKIWLMSTLVFSMSLYACETWTLMVELQHQIKAMEMRCYCTVLCISSKYHVTNSEVQHRGRKPSGPMRIYWRLWKKEVEMVWPCV